MDAGTANEGTIYNESSPIYSERIYGSQGIYLDSYSQNIEVSDNTVVNNGKGIFLHNCKNIKLYNNVVYNNRQRQVDIYNDNVKYPPVRNVKMEGNIFLAGNAIQDIAGFRSERDDIKQFGNFDNNCYGKPVSNINGICVGYIDKNGKKMATIYDADAWTKTFKNDKNKKNLPFTFKEYKLKRVLSSNKYSNGLYNTDISGTSSFSGSGIDVSAWDNSGKLDRGCYKLSYRRNEKGKTTNVIIAVGAIEANKHYILKYSILGTKENRSYGVYLRQGQAPYEDLTPVKYFSLKKTRVDNEVLFSPLISDKNSQIVFKFNNSDDNVYFDNIELKEADVELSNFSDSIRFEFNPTNKIKTIRLSKNYVDINQNKYSGSFQLQPYTSILLFPATVHKKETKTNAIVTKLDSVAADGFLVYPNPASTVLNINLPPAKSKVLLSIFDMGGKSVLNKEYELDYKKRASSSLQMDITSLSKGLYILTVRSSTYHFQEKFIKIE
jgi:parallel beta-helix repeat protein